MANWDRRRDFRYTENALRKEARYQRENLAGRGLYPYEVIEEVPYTENGDLFILRSETPQSQTALQIQKRQPETSSMNLIEGRRGFIHRGKTDLMPVRYTLQAAKGRPACRSCYRTRARSSSVGPMKVTMVCPNYASVFEYPRQAALDGVVGEVQVAFSVGIDGSERRSHQIIH